VNGCHADALLSIYLLEGGDPDTFFSKISEERQVQFVLKTGGFIVQFNELEALGISNVVTIRGSQADLPLTKYSLHHSPGHVEAMILRIGDNKAVKMSDEEAKHHYW